MTRMCPASPNNLDNRVQVASPSDLDDRVISDRVQASASDIPTQPDGSTEGIAGQWCPWLPVSLSLAGVTCLVVGGGKVAARKAESLYRCGAILTVVAPTTVEQMDRLVQRSVEAAGGNDTAQDYVERDSAVKHNSSRSRSRSRSNAAQDSASRSNITNSAAVHDTFRQTSGPAPLQAITVVRREYKVGEAAKYRLVIAATGNLEVDHLVAEDATQAGALVNVADDAKPSNMLFPAVFRDGPVSVAVSTEGASPAFASWLRNELQRSLPRGLGILARLLEEARNALHAANLSTERIDWHDLIDGRTSGSPGLLTLLGTLSTRESTPSSCKDSQEQDRIEEARSYISDYIFQYKKQAGRNQKSSSGEQLAN